MTAVLVVLDAVLQVWNSLGWLRLAISAGATIATVGKLIASAKRSAK